jgi:hypothetical protein
MSCRSIRPLALLAGALLAAACQEGSPTTPAEASLELEAAIAQAGDDAARSGDTERAEALSHGARALRCGIRPSMIEVKVENETHRYLAIVVGVVRHRAGGERVLVRSLVAWTGRPPTALLQVISASDQALFGHPDENESGPGAARGHWKNLVHHQLWVATAGSAGLELVATGNPCPAQPSDLGLRYLLASYDVRINGNFQLVGTGGPAGPPIEIHTSSAGVHGVVIKPAD